MSIRRPNIPNIQINPKNQVSTGLTSPSTSGMRPHPFMQKQSMTSAANHKKQRSIFGRNDKISEHVRTAKSSFDAATVRSGGMTSTHMSTDYSSRVMKYQSVDRSYHHDP